MVLSVPYLYMYSNTKLQLLSWSWRAQVQNETSENVFICDILDIAKVTATQLQSVIH